MNSEQDATPNKGAPSRPSRPNTGFIFVISGLWMLVSSLIYIAMTVTNQELVAALRPELVPLLRIGVGFLGLLGLVTLVTGLSRVSAAFKGSMPRKAEEG